MNTDDKSIHIARARDEALDWHVRLSGDEATNHDWQDFTAWLEADAAHRIAYDDVEDLAVEIELRKGPLAAAVHAAEALASDSNVMPFKTRETDQGFKVNATRRSWILAAGALAASVALFVVTQTPSRPASTAQYATAAGSTRTVVLADGSQLHLNANTNITVAFEPNERRATLNSGEATFDIAKDPSRPFVVFVADQRVEVVGTAFNILKYNGDVTITVSRGIVKVGPHGEPSDGMKTERLIAGDQLTHREGSNESSKAKVDPSIATAWREGRLVFEDAPLSKVVADLNRYFDRPIRIKDETLANVHFSGVLKIDNETNVLHRLEDFLPIRVQEESDGVIIERRQNKK